MEPPFARVVLMAPTTTALWGWRVFGEKGEGTVPAEELARRQVRVDALLGQAFRLAGEHLEGINDQAAELARQTGGDRRILEAARRVALALAELEPSTLTKQVVSLMRRALEIGEWTWDQ